VEHPCPKCGEAVEDGIPFCRACRAPQIRVVGIEPQAETVPDAHPAAEDLTIPAVAPTSDPSPIRWSQALPCAALGGALTLMLALIPFAVFGPACVAGGAFSVMLYRRRAANTFPTPARGAWVGAASGGFAFLFSAIPMIAALVYRADELRKAMAASVTQFSSRGYDPDKVQQVLELLKTPEGLSFFVGFGLFVMCVIFVVGASIGGAWYAAWARKRARR
jgi:hypothetical protein